MARFNWRKALLVTVLVLALVQVLVGIANGQDSTNQNANVAGNAVAQVPEASSPGVGVDVDSKASEQLAAATEAAQKVVESGEGAALNAEQVDMLERVLFGLPEPDARLPTTAEKRNLSPEEYKNLLAKIWSKRQEEIRKAMESMDDEGEIMRKLAGTIGNATMDEAPTELLDALADAEDWVSDLDYASHFAKLGGIHQCVTLMANHKDTEVRTLAAFTLGSAIKNNAALQDLALEIGVVPFLDSHFKQTLLPCAGSDKLQARECGKMMYALSSLVRGHISSQAQVISSGLLDTLTTMLAQPNLDTRMLIKVSALVYDSFTEWPTCPAQWSVNGTESTLCLNLEQQALNVLQSIPKARSEALVMQAKSKLRQALEAAGCQSTKLPESFFLVDAKEL